jgi:hypothetical protein
MSGVPLNVRPAKEHGFPKVVHPRQVSRPVNVSDVVEDRAEQRVVPHAVIEHVHETRNVATISDVEPESAHVTLLWCSRNRVKLSVGIGHVSLRLRKVRGSMASL